MDYTFRPLPVWPHKPTRDRRADLDDLAAVQAARSEGLV